jgi:hypothetical protein
VLRRISGPVREEIAGSWRKMHNKELHNLYSSLDIIRMIKSRKIRWAGHTAHMGEMRNLLLVRKTEGKKHLGDLGIDEG